MCNFYGVNVSKVNFIKLKKIERELGTLAALNELQTIINAFDYGNGIILRKSGNEYKLSLAHWEFIPGWIKNEAQLMEARKKGIPWVNAKGENLLDSKMWRPAALARRCLVPATHFFEWRHYKPAGAKKEIAYPYCIKKYDEDVMYFAGIWQEWTDKETGETIDTYAIVTTKANELMAQIHNKNLRMPTMLTENLAYEWLDDISEERIKEIATYQISSEDLWPIPIHRDFKNIPNPLERNDYPELPPLDVAV